MSDILTLVFKMFRSQSELSAVNEGSLAPAPAPARSALVVGEQVLSRSVLLLAAVTAASEGGFRVVFLTQTQIQSLPVALQRRVPNLTPATLKKIQFCYPRTLEELLVQVAGLHQSPHSPPSAPALIIVDGLEGYLCASGPSISSGVHTSEQSSAAHLSALLCDTASFLTHVLEKHGSAHAPCRLIASFQPQGDSEQKGGEASTNPILDVLDRYFQMRCILDQDRSYESTSGGLQQVWNIYLSCLGRRKTSCRKDGVEKKEDQAVQEWRLLLSPDGLMEFKQAQKL
ncbi:ATPase SWSAP1 [Eucyclogobius newberryi]|uniref:ATPase SWSAP1 n=1 Tax=Eucyclogobius newberryi TaxID=166745 RepID=UPI003B5A4CCF